MLYSWLFQIIMTPTVSHGWLNKSLCDVISCSANFLGMVLAFPVIPALQISFSLLECSRKLLQTTLVTVKAQVRDLPKMGIFPYPTRS